MLYIHIYTLFLYTVYIYKYCIYIYCVYIYIYCIYIYIHTLNVHTHIYIYMWVLIQMELFVQEFATWEPRVPSVPGSEAMIIPKDSAAFMQGLACA